MAKREVLKIDFFFPTFQKLGERDVGE